jgi:hypothetical protein
MNSILLQTFFSKNLSFNNLSVFIINKDNYNEYETILENVNICDRNYISNNYEKLSFLSLEEDNYTGIFIKDENNNINAFMIVDYNCNQIIEKINLPNLNNILNKSIEIMLVCSNFYLKKKGLIREMLNLLINFLLENNPEKNYIMLSTCKTNEQAIKFYKRFGFVQINNNIFIKSIIKNGGKQKCKKTKKTKKHKTKKTKNKKLK